MCERPAESAAGQPSHTEDVYDYYESKDYSVENLLYLQLHVKLKQTAADVFLLIHCQNCWTELVIVTV